jgi:hypothetical protein
MWCVALTLDSKDPSWDLAQRGSKLGRPFSSGWAIDNWYARGRCQ